MGRVIIEHDASRERRPSVTASSRQDGRHEPADQHARWRAHEAMRRFLASLRIRRSGRWDESAVDNFASATAGDAAAGVRRAFARPPFRATRTGSPTSERAGGQEVVAAALRDESAFSVRAGGHRDDHWRVRRVAVAMQLVVDPARGVFNCRWFFYEALVVNAGGVPVKIPVDRRTFDLDLAAIEAAITPRTRAIIVNTPNNPTGRVYPAALLAELADLLDRASRRHGRPIWIISDEPYRRIRFDGVPFASPLAVYPHSLMSYSYGKILLTPGQRLGYLAMPPTLPNREAIRMAQLTLQAAGGHLFPNAIMQHGIADFERISIDLDRSGEARRMVGAARHRLRLHCRRDVLPPPRSRGRRHRVLRELAARRRPLPPTSRDARYRIR